MNLPGDAFKASEELSSTGYHIMRTSLINWFDFETFSVTFYWSRQVPLRCKSNIPREGVELHGKWAGVTLTVSFPHRQSAQIPFLVGKLVNTSTSHTSHFAAQEQGERCEVRDWKQQVSAAGTSCYPAEFIWMHFISYLLGFGMSIWVPSALSRWHVHSPWKGCFV